MDRQLKDNTFEDLLNNLNDCIVKLNALGAAVSLMSSADEGEGIAEHGQVIGMIISDYANQASELIEQHFETFIRVKGCKKESILDLVP